LAAMYCDGGMERNGEDMPVSMSQLQWPVAVLWKGLCVFGGQDEGGGDRGFVLGDHCVGLVAIFERRNRVPLLVGGGQGHFVRPLVPKDRPGVSPSLNSKDAFHTASERGMLMVSEGRGVGCGEAWWRHEVSQSSCQTCPSTPQPRLWK
jgi:hypothetical protein